MCAVPEMQDGSVEVEDVSGWFGCDALAPANRYSSCHLRAPWLLSPIMCARVCHRGLWLVHEGDGAFSRVHRTNHCEAAPHGPSCPEDGDPGAARTERDYESIVRAIDVG